MKVRTQLKLHSCRLCGKLYLGDSYACDGCCEDINEAEELFTLDELEEYAKAYHLKSKRGIGYDRKR